MITDQDVDMYLWLLEQEQLALEHQIEDMEQAEDIGIYNQMYQPNLKFIVEENER